MNTRILVVVGTPIPDSLNHALAHAYADSARSGGAQVRIVDLAEHPVPGHPVQRDQLRTPRDEHDVPLDAEVAAYLDDLQWAEHITIFFPQWWGTYPAALKAYLDRVFLSGFAFRYHETGKGWDRLLTGRSARLVMTMDSPNWWVRWVYGDSAVRSLTRATLWYCGVRVRGITRFAEVRHQSPAMIEGWIRRAAQLGSKDAAMTAATRVPEPVTTA
ncbi:MAG: NAD(P)H-dependent oxidoreductase [Microbacterium sp.]